MAFIDIKDNLNKTSLVLFKEVYEQTNNININDIIHIFGHVERRYNEYQIVVKQIEKLD